MHGQQLTRSASPPLVIDGDGGALPSLAAQGDLADGRTLEFAGDTSDDKVARRDGPREPR